MSLLLSRRFSSWQELGFLAIFLMLVAGAVVLGVTARQPWILRMFRLTMHASSQLPVRISILILVGLFLLAEKFGFESIFGAFAAGMVVGLASRGEKGDLLREKIDAVMFGWFYPFFFVSTGIRLDLPGLTHDLRTAALVPLFLMLFLAVRGASVVLYGKALARSERMPFALSVSVPSLSIIVVITDIGTTAGTMTTDVAASLVGAAVLSTMLFPTIAGVLLGRIREPHAERA
jgi:Kef-type K+ transport system membrane component KefB